MSYLSESELAARRANARRTAARRRLIGGVTLVAALIAVVGWFAIGRSNNAGSQRHTSATPSAVVSHGARRSAHHAAIVLPRIEPAHSGTAHLISRGPARNEVALTFDDGFCAACVALIIHTLAVTGAHATIFPNGRYASLWAVHAVTIRRLVATGQLTIGNHTFLHRDAVEESPSSFQADLLHEESWIEQTFGVTARPFFRPPYGAYDSSTLAIAGRSGYTKVIYWSGTLADSSPRTPAYILAAIRYWAHPGAIILAHGNYPTTARVLPQILAILRRRGLRPVTLREMLG